MYAATLSTLKYRDSACLHVSHTKTQILGLHGEILILHCQLRCMYQGDVVLFPYTTARVS